jgi:hypothetical protein
VALHVGSLIKRGHLRKREHSARSLEVVHEAGESDGEYGHHERWLVGRVENLLKKSAEAVADGAGAMSGGQLADESRLLIDALRLLGMGDQADQLQSKMLESYGLVLAAEEAV